MKQLRIVYNTGEISEAGQPVLRRGTFAVEDFVTTTQAEQIANLIDSLSSYTVQEAYLVTVTQVI
ncbi:MAG: hypothetical protein H5T93_04020 [Pseudothermotoga sp.]|uniref:DUF1659 domain-containing protein n=1 Tax=Pseudothermotoga sp. TaxID=2033661 RepID=UPI00076D7429|nr:MAG: hypothetical protein XD45_0752 [Thermotoga sp. 50_64]MBC7116187.1 hypothetical protein [Pseudothermotoga sp.]HBT38789.1 hypothetical protein [Pseudothermotoga sp.]HCO98302.1 hypothetical protein [Pseudothermotoga sp.]